MPSSMAWLTRIDPVRRAALSGRMSAFYKPLRPSRDGVIAVYLAYLAFVLQTLARAPIRLSIRLAR